MYAMHPRDYGAALIDNTWDYTPEQTDRIGAALASAPDVDAAMARVTEAARCYRAFSVAQEGKPRYAEVTAQLKKLHEIAKSLHDILSPRNNDLHMALVPHDLHGLWKQSGSLMAVTAQALDSRPSGSGRPPDRALTLFLRDLIRVWDDQGLNVGAYKKPNSRLQRFVRASIEPVIAEEGVNRALSRLCQILDVAKVSGGRRKTRMDPWTEEETALVTEHMDLATRVAKTLEGKAAGLGVDAHGEAQEALVRAARNYQGDRGTPFDIYAEIWIRKAIKGKIARAVDSRRKLAQAAEGQQPGRAVHRGRLKIDYD